MWNRYGAIVGAIAGTIAIIVYMYNIDSHWVKTTVFREYCSTHDQNVVEHKNEISQYQKKIINEIHKVSKRLDQKILQDRSTFYQERIWAYDDRYPNSIDMPPHTKTEYRTVILEKIEIDKQLALMGN